MEDDRKKRVESSPSNNPLAEFLIESGWKPLVLIGNGMKYFGLGPVLGFLLGIGVTAAGHYFGLYKLPPHPVPPPEKVPIHVQGRVLTLENKPLKSFEVGILVDKQGPFDNGAFDISVPQKDRYDILVWTPGYKFFKLYGGRSLVTKHGKHSLEDLAGFPANLGIVEGTIKDHNGAPVAGYVEIAKKVIRTDDKGYFRSSDIPLGQLKVLVRRTGDGPVLHEEDIDVQLTDPTPHKEIIIRKR